MGVYHLMGLGRSPGTVTGPLSYLAHRYQRWNPADEQFFARSGERDNRAHGEKVGDVQALILITTREVLDGKALAYEYTDNPSGRVTKGPQIDGRPMKEALRHLLSKEWPGVAGGRTEGNLFWCESDRRDIDATYDRIILLIAALANVGGRGHEMWINLTGGNNVTNLALELAANLSGDVARLYYVQAENRDAERCVHFTAENGYWVELPVMPLALGRLTLAILDVLAREPLNGADLYSRARRKYWNLMGRVDSQDAFVEDYVKPMWKQGLVAETTGRYTVGPQWELIRHYQERLEEARKTPPTIEQLARRESWIHRETISLTP